MTVLQEYPISIMDSFKVERSLQGLVRDLGHHHGDNQQIMDSDVR